MPAKTNHAGSGVSTALEGAVDTAVLCEASDGVVTITIEKQKSATSGQQRRLSLTPVGDSCVLTEYRGRTSDPTALTRNDRTALAVLIDIEIEGGSQAAYGRPRPDSGARSSTLVAASSTPA
jgi:hypothetical protein